MPAGPRHHPDEQGRVSPSLGLGPLPGVRLNDLLQELLDRVGEVVASRERLDVVITVSSNLVVGTVFDTVYADGAYLTRPSDPGGAQALDLAPAHGGFVEFVLPEAGTYTMLSHRFADATRGGIGRIIATPGR